MKKLLIIPLLLIFSLIGCSSDTTSINKQRIDNDLFTDGQELIMDIEESIKNKVEKFPDELISKSEEFLDKYSSDTTAYLDEDAEDFSNTVTSAVTAYHVYTVTHKEKQLDLYKECVKKLKTKYGMKLS